LAASVAEAIGADEKFGCALFDATKAGVAGMLSFLVQKLRT
jgi:hypothetical protein